MKKFGAKVSFITTVYNEENSIESFLSSLLNQTKLPDEIIIVDANSSDYTYARAYNFLLRHSNKIPFRVLVKIGNRSVGRNTAIRFSTGDIIVCSDSGCILDKNWIEEITKPFVNKKINVVSGYYQPIARTLFQRCLSLYTSVMKGNINPDTFLPSSRSVAFRKVAWQRVDGYPEELSTCEDLVFAKKMKDSGMNFAFAEKALVKWPQRKNIKSAVKQFFSYAYGDGYAHYFRWNTPFLFLRILLFVYLLILGYIEKSVAIIILLTILSIFYILWSTLKNYIYIQNKKAFFYLPLLQIISDLTVSIGTSFGYVMSIKRYSLIGFIKRERSLLSIIIMYTIFELSILSWGLPNKFHPFTYHMDEWHQLQAVKSVFKYGTPNVEGAANGTMFHFLLSGLFLIPFTLMGIIHPFSVTSAVDSIDIQRRIFEVLRLNTIVFGVLSIIVIHTIAKYYLKLKSYFVIFLFTINPIFLLLSNYYKYDIALIFWVNLSLLMLLRYGKFPTFNNYFFSGLPIAFAIGTKISALPLIIIYIIAYFYFTIKPLRQLKTFFVSIIFFLFIFCITSIPDLLLKKGSLIKYMYDNIVVFPSGSSNFILHFPTEVYVFILQFPVTFGHFLYTAGVLGFILSIILSILRRSNKNITFICFSFFVFVMSLLQLQIAASGNRSLVLLPFLALFSGVILQVIVKNGYYKIFIWLIILLGLGLQSIESYAWIYPRYKSDPRITSSTWLINTITKGSSIGVEVPLLYQFVPDNILKQYYEVQYNPQLKLTYKLIDIDANTLSYPRYVIVSNAELHKDLFIKSDKKTLLTKLIFQKYKKIKQFSPDLSLYHMFGDDSTYFISGLTATPLAISIYEKK